MPQTATSEQQQVRNPHFDDDLILWDDSYSGKYLPVVYGDQFDGQWKLYSEKKTGFHEHTGVETSDEYIDDRIQELTGVKDYLLRKKWGALAPLVSKALGREKRQEKRGVGGRLYLEPKFDVDYFVGKRCIDIACGAGRWTRTMTALGGKVKAIDVSKNGLASTKRFTDDVELLSLFDLKSRTDLAGSFDFTLAWGVFMNTHDPRLAFENAAHTVRPGGSMYFMVYAPSYHISPFVINARRHYHRELKTFEERLAYAYELSGAEPENAINQLDMLNTFYNWVIDWPTIEKWCSDFGFTSPVFLNKNEPNACGFHVLTKKKA